MKIYDFGIYFVEILIDNFIFKVITVRGRKAKKSIYIELSEMKLLNFINIGFSTLMLGLISSPAMAASITLDSFTDVDETELNDDPVSSDPFIQRVDDNVADGTSVSNTDGSLSGVIGGTRTISVNKTGGRQGTTFLVDSFEGFEKASFSSGDATTGTFSLIYDGDGFGDGIDLTGGGTNDSFAIDVVTNDLGVTLNFEVFDGTNTATSSQTVAAGELGTKPFPFADFSNQSSLEQAQSVTMYSSGAPAALDFGFQDFRAVPFEFSPSLGIILCGGLFGIHKLRKIYQNSQS